jgi:hypothetical protein
MQAGRRRFGSDADTGHGEGTSAAIIFAHDIFCLPFQGFGFSTVCPVAIMAPVG